MSIKFFVQWIEWIRSDSYGWSEFDFITLSYEKDRVAGDYTVVAALLGFGVTLHYISRKSVEKLIEKGKL